MPNILQPSLSNTPTYKQTTETTGVAPYATDLLQRGQAFTTAETPVYGGQLTTGPSQYQEQAWKGIAGLTVPQNITAAGTQLGNISQQQQGLSYDPTKFTAGTFGTEQAQKYMNPYIQAALDPQLEYMRRQAAISQQGDMAKLAQAGAFGGSRQAILQGANQEALLRQQAATAGAGYEKAYNAAMAQYNADQAREMEAQKASEQSKQFGAGYKQTGLSSAANTEQARAQAGASEAQYGLANLNALSAAGSQQQALEQAALDAQYKDWLRQTEYPSKQIEQQKNLITAMGGVLPKTETIYGQKEATSKTAAGILGGAAAALGIKTMDDLVAKAKQYGLTPEKFKEMLGITGGTTVDTNEELKLPPGAPSEEGSRRAETGLEEPPIEEVGALPPDDFVSPVFTIPEDYEGDFGDYAQGGLIDLLHKMRSYK
jgi:hypothetical protein